jgi:hypothetical protein
MARFPDFLILGAPKCGTTSLKRYLQDQSSVYLPEGEPHFFTYVAEGRPHWGVETVDEYADLFEEADPEQV